MITIATISQESRRSVRAWAVLAPLIPLRALDGKMCNEGTQEGKKAERSHEDEGNQEHNASISFLCIATRNNRVYQEHQQRPIDDASQDNESQNDAGAHHL